MHIPIHIKVICKQESVEKVKEFLSPNKLIHIMEFHDVKTTDKDMGIVDISGVVFDVCMYRKFSISVLMTHMLQVIEIIGSLQYNTIIA